MRIFRRIRKRKTLLSDAEIALLRRENEEAARGQMNPFALNTGPDALTKATGVGFLTSGPVANFGSPNSEKEENQRPEK